MGSVLHSKEMCCAWLVMCRYTGMAMVDGRRSGETIGAEPRRELNGKVALLVYATKPMRWTAMKTPSRGGMGVGLGKLMEATGTARRLGPCCGQGGMGVGWRLRPSGGRGGNDV